MKLLKTALGIAVGGAMFTLMGMQSKSPEMPPKDKTDQKVEKLLKKMTLEEKVGQMTQVTLEVISVGEGTAVASPHQLDEEKMRKMIVDYKVGSILNCAGMPHSKERWNEMISKMQEMATKQTRLGIPIIYGIDAIHGTNYTTGSTLFPQQVGLAATWNTELVEQAAELCAYETRASSIPWNFSPVLDLGIDPRWPRQWEGFGEDPYLSSEMGVAMVKGFEGDQLDKYHVASCLKHYIGYGAPQSGKDRTPAWIPERMMYELFVPAFKKAIDAGSRTIMINSGEVNGVPVHASHKLLTTLLRDELGFEGVAVTDWYDIWNLVERHHVAKDKKEAVKLAVLAGVDMSMVPYDVEFADLLIELVKEGTITEERIDLSVRRILKLKYELGLFENPVTNLADYKDFGSDKFIGIAKDAATESITLLKNNKNVLPLNKTAKVLVTGPNANSMRTLNGGWSYTWQGDRTDEFAKDKQTVLEAIQAKIGTENVLFEQGVQYVAGADYKTDEIVDINAVLDAADKADVILLCLGENSYTEKPGDLNDLTLSSNQIRLAQAAASTGTPVVLLLNEGRPRIINGFEGEMDAILQAFLPGNEGGVAIADILFGDANPSGKLPYTYPRNVNDLVPYYHKFSENLAHNDGNEYTDPFFNPQYEFGFGLSYTTFEYSDLKLAQKEINKNGELEVSIKLTNTGNREGKEVVQLYTTDLVASITPSVKRLKAFQKVALKAGESKTVTFSIPAKDLSFIGLENKPVLEEGTFKVTVGNLTEEFELVNSL
ncbi:glycoside hydrolase family 3 N-terminal domain-containing protein [Limibacter armeniacum]|uniref:glycoside hydrolase family 3 N-terminal domain-containing protein n=1 Tax=Limibacter armeniacum TaxID=466084 RepID=UPI002FE6999A